MAKQSFVNGHGNTVETDFFMYRERYHYDEKLGADWAQYDTDQDASYFGVWVNATTRQVMTWAEGDESLTTCPTVESFQAELDSMAECYGPAPAAIRALGFDGSKTEIFDERPGIDPEVNREQKSGFTAQLAAILG
jgi:hypothetical protein